MIAGLRLGPFAGQYFAQLLPGDIPAQPRVEKQHLADYGFNLLCPERLRNHVGRL